MFKRRIVKEQGILIEKKIIVGNNKPNEVSSLMSMKLGTYNSSVGNKVKKTKEYCFYVMTKKGVRIFVVDSTIYNKVSLDSLGMIERKGSKLISFTLEKIATKEDIKELNW